MANVETAQDNQTQCNTQSTYNESKFIPENKIDDVILKLIKPEFVINGIRYYDKKSVKIIQQSSEYMSTMIHTHKAITESDMDNIYAELKNEKYKIEIYDFNLKKIRKLANKFIRTKTHIKNVTERIIHKYIINTIRHEYSNYNDLARMIGESDFPAWYKNEMVKIIKRRTNGEIYKRLKKK